MKIVKFKKIKVKDDIVEGSGISKNYAIFINNKKLNLILNKVDMILKKYNISREFTNIYVYRNNFLAYRKLTFCRRTTIEHIEDIGTAPYTISRELEMYLENN